MLVKTMQEWVDLLEANNVPCGPIYNMQQVFEDPHVRHRQMKFTLPHATGVDSPSLANPIRFSDTPISYGRAAPVLGQDNDEIFNKTLGFSPEYLAELKAKHVI